MTALPSANPVKVLASITCCVSVWRPSCSLPKKYNSLLSIYSVAMSFQFDLQKPKRFKQALTLAQKINILDCLRDGMGATAVGRMYGINESSVRFIRKNEEKIRQSTNGFGVINGAQGGTQPHYSPVSRNATLVRAEEEISEWMAIASEQKVPLSAKGIREKAKEIYHRIRDESPNPYLIPDFVASKSWYSRFMRRNCHFSPKYEAASLQPGESPASYYRSSSPNASYEVMSPSNLPYETMSPSDTSDINANNNNEYMASDPEVILLDCEEERDDAKPPRRAFASFVEAQQNFHEHEQEVLQDKGTEMETNEQSTQISGNVSNKVDDNNSELQSRLQQEIQNHEITREECEAISQESERIQEMNRTLTKKLEGKEDEIVKLKALLNGKDQQIKRQRSQFDDTLKNLCAANKVKSNLTSRISEQDKKIARLELHNQDSASTVSPARQQSREELKIVRDALHSLRNSFQSNNPQQHTIDTLEQSFATLMERLHSMESQLRVIQPANLCETNSVQPGNLLNYDSTGDPKRSPITKLQGSNDKSFSSEEGSEGWTKVLYYTERSVTPYLFHIPKRIGEITLKDFKDSFDRPGLYRFHFKTIDPEFGMVKEEVVHDHEIIPGLEGKVIAWIEEDV